MDGLSTSAEYAKRAAELGMTHLSITDHGTDAGHREHQRACKEAGIIPILGQEMYFSPTDRFDRRTAANRSDDSDVYNHLTVLSMNENGLRNLNTLSDRAWTEGYYNKGRIDLELIEEYSEDIIMLSGCISGPIAKALDKGLPHRAEAFAKDFKEILGDRFFIEIMSHNPAHVNEGLLALAEKYDIMPVVTSDCHRSLKEDLWIQDALLILSTGPKPAKTFSLSKSQQMDYMERFNYLYPERTMTFQEFELHLNSAEEHRIALERVGVTTDIIENTNRVAEMIGDYPYYEGLDLLPRPEENEDDVLRRMVFDGLADLGFDKDPAYIKRAEEELEIIKTKGFSVYFIIGADAVGYARDNGIRVGPGRGSAGGSLVCYAIGITRVDPIKHGTLFFRFLSLDRLGWPDADIDFEDQRRSEVKDYIRRKYVHVANIATFGKFKDKGVVRDAARVFRVPLPEVNSALKFVDSFEAFKTSPTTSEFRRKYPEVTELAENLRGRIRSIGMHAGGLVIANQPISNFVPTQTAKDPDNASGPRVSYIACDMVEAEKIGLIKYDFLGLKTLSVIADACRMIKDRHGVELDLDHMEMDDPAVYEALSNGETVGSFQSEATPYTRMLIDIGGVKDFTELAASNALVRPGAANSSFGATYVNGKNGARIKSLHPDVDDFLEETYGVPLYQEQVMLLCVHLAGMSAAESEHVRKAISKKVAKDLAVWKEKFVEGAALKIGHEKAEALWHDIEASSDYSFNKSHAIAYSMLTYQTMWLKLNYPIEFMCAALKNEKDKDTLLDYLTETKRMGIKVLLPDVNKSDKHFAIMPYGKAEAIRFGLSNIKYISDKIAQRLIDNRPYESYKHLSDIVLAKGSGLSSRALQSMNAIGACTFPDNPKRGDERESFYEYLNIPAFEIKDLPQKVKMQFRPLDEYEQNESFLVLAMVRGIKTGEGWARIDMVDETGHAGAFTDEHNMIESGKMYAFLISENRIARYISMENWDDASTHDLVKFIMADSLPMVVPGTYKVVAFNVRTTKNGAKMANLVLADEKKNLTSAVVFPREFFHVYSKVTTGSIVDFELEETKTGGGLCVKKVREVYE
jgi:DNA polymerase-3 subunit alpha